MVGNVVGVVVGRVVGNVVGIVVGMVVVIVVGVRVLRILISASGGIILQISSPNEISSIAMSL